MSNFEQLTKYDFHDSLLESLSYDKDNNQLSLIIDFCNWKQEWYHESDEETSMISIIFSNISNIVIPKLKLNSDEIIEFEVLEDNTIKILIFNDIDDASYEIVICAEDVEILK